MAQPPIEQDVILDADGRPLFSAMEFIRREIDKIQSSIRSIQRDSYKSANDFGKTVAARAKELQTAASQLRTLSGTPGSSIQDLNADKKLSRMTVEASKYARELNTARNAAEALDLKIASIQKRMAERGRNNQFATLGQTDQLKKLEQAANALKKLDQQFNAMQTKARQQGGDFSAEIRSVMEARQKLFAAASDGRRTNLGPEVIGVTDAQAAMAERIAQARSQEVSNLRAGYAVRKEIAVAEAAQIRGAEALERARLQNMQRISSLREQLKTSEASENRTLLEQLEIEKARGRQIALNTRELNQQQRGASMGAGAPGKTPLQNILSPGYAAAAFARTGIYGAAAGAAYGAFNTVQGSLSNVVELQDELAKLAAISNSTDTQMQSLKASIFAVGEGSRYSLVDLTKISQTLAQAGVSASQMEDVLRSVTTLATASGSTPDEAVQLVTSALGAFQLQATEAARVADLMTSALNRTKLTVQQTGQAIQYVGSTAYEQNISLEQLLATVGAVAQAGVRSGSTIGTGFRQFLVDLQSPTEKLTTTLKNLGLTSADIDVSVRGLPAVLETLKNSGFGAAQAYDSLETRAAAFYLTAKNNTEVMDQLQLSFANSGAAALANERAMDSLTSQWQRFKNLLAEGFAKDMELPLQLLQRVLESISDKIQEMNNTAAQLAERQQGGLQGYVDRAGGGIMGAVKGFAQYENENFVKDLTGSLYDLQNAALDLLTPSFYTGGKGMGQMWDEYLTGAQNAATATRDTATAVATTSEAVDNQRGRISELDREIQRLITQKASLRDNDVRSAAETATLTSRFQGLAIYLQNTKNKYDDLTQAAIAYRNAQIGLLNTDLLAQKAALAVQSGESERTAVGGINALRGNKAAMSKLTPAERAALGQLGNGNRSDDQRAMGILSDAVGRLQKIDPALSRQVNQIVQAVGTISTNTAQMSAMNVEIANNTAAQSTFGQHMTGTLRDVDAAISQLGSTPRNKQRSAANTARSRLDAAAAEANKITDPSLAAYAQQSLEEIKSRRAQIDAILAPTKAETREVAKVEPREKISRQAVIDVVQGLGLGTRVGSGYRTAAEQQALFNAGKTRATAGTGTHHNGIGQDFPISGNYTKEQQAQVEARVRNALKNAGMDPDEVRFETGHGKHQGTGQHVHVGYRKNRRMTAGTSSEARAAVNLDKMALSSLDDILDTRLKDLSKATSTEVFDASEAAAKKSLDAWAAQLEKLTQGEIAGQGMNAEQAGEKLRQMKQQIAQKREEFQQKVGEAIIKNLENQLKAAQLEFNKNMRPYETSLSTAQGSLAGFDYYSMRNNVPDYTRTLATNRVAQASEARDRARLSNLPGLISSEESALSLAQGRADSGSLTDAQLEQTKQRIQELTQSVITLKDERDSLEAAFGSRGLLPSGFKEGLSQAIQAYQQTHDLMRTLKQDIVVNLGGALETVHQGLTDLFTNIMNGSQTVLQAFGNFAKGIMSWMVQMAAKAVATQIFGALLKIGAAFLGPSVAPGSAGGMNMSGWDGAIIGSFNGGPAIPEGMLRGGEVMNGSKSRDSVTKRLAKGEWVVNSRAVDSVGPDFMANLNQHGSKAIDAMRGMQQINVLPKQEMNVYVVSPQQRPQMTKGDVLVTLQEDILRNGETKRLIQTVANER